MTQGQFLAAVAVAAERGERGDIVPPRIDDRGALLILVHPGDALEVSDGLSRSQRDRLAENSVSQQEMIGREILDLVKQPRTIVVLHRESSPYLADEADVFYDETYRDACFWAVEHGVNLYGDDLDSALSAITRLVDIKAQTEILVTGAYGNASDGCAAYIARKLYRDNPCTQLSEYAYLQPGRRVRVWRPRARTFTAAPGHACLTTV